MKETNDYIKDDLHLIELCQKNDQSAFEQIYRSYNKAMYNVCFRMLNNSQEAEDVLQESFISAFNQITSYSKKSTFGAWLKRIVINKCIDVLRKRNQNFISLEDEYYVEESIEEEVEVTYDVESIKKAMLLLPDGYRIILTLYVFENFTHRQIAEKLGIQEGTSKSQYARAKKKLIELITHNTPSYER